MTILVTGANGLVGSRLVARLGGERVVAIGRGPRRFSDPAEYLDVDLLATGRLAQIIADLHPAAVINAAAMTDVDACEADPVGAWLLNARLVESAALACREIG